MIHNFMWPAKAIPLIFVGWEVKRILHLTSQLPLKVLENVFLHQIKVLCEQPRELTHDFLDYV